MTDLQATRDAVAASVERDEQGNGGCVKDVVTKIVPARRKHLSPEDFAKGNLKGGETFSIDSGLGGSWTVEYTGRNRHGQLVFVRRAKNDWPEQRFYYDTSERAAEALYILVAE